MSEENIITKENTNKKRSILKSSIFLGILLIAVWIGLIFMGYFYIENSLKTSRDKIQDYVDNSINNVIETNALNVKEMEERLESINYELRKISRGLDQADKSLKDSNSSREELNEKIESLDKQLNELKESLGILKETP